MNSRIHRLALAAALVSLCGLAAAAEPVSAAASAAAQLKEKARLATLCDACGIVQRTRSERREGEAKGIGAVGGAVAGGVVGKSATDSTAGTVGGAVIGGVLGHQVEKRMKRHKVWITTVTMKDGSTRSFEADKDPKWATGTVVEVVDGKLNKR